MTTYSTDPEMQSGSWPYRGEKTRKIDIDSIKTIDDLKVILREMDLTVHGEYSPELEPYLKPE